MKATKETSDQIGKCEKCGATQFLFYGICNYNGICDGKVIPIESSTRQKALSRQKAIAWWKTQGQGRQNYLTNTYIGGQRFSHSLTGREIEEIWLKETGEKGIIITNISKPNQKQFKTFNSELARAYLNKFDNTAKKHFCLETFNMLSKSDLQYLKACLTEIISER